MNEREVIEVVDNMKDVPSISSIVGNIIEIVDSPTSSASDLTKVISTDQALAAKVLKLVNSSFYGFPRKIDTLNQAVVILGFNTVRSLALSISVIDVVSRHGASHRLNYKNLWLHAFTVAGVSRELARKNFSYLSDEAFVAGLLHDIGYIILDKFFLGEFYRAMDIMESEKIPLYKAEHEVYNLTHANVGMILAERWNMPNTIGYSIGYHHNPSPAKDYFELASIVHASNLMVKLLKKNKAENTYIGCIGDESYIKYSDFYEESRKLLRISPDFYNSLNEMEEEINKSMQESFEIFRILLM